MVLVLNAGSSSMKFGVVVLPSRQPLPFPTIRHSSSNPALRLSPHCSRLITLYLGNRLFGDGHPSWPGRRHIDGIHPLEGLVMGTRAGDFDPDIVGYLARCEHVALDQVERWLNRAMGSRVSDAADGAIE